MIKTEIPEYAVVHLNLANRRYRVCVLYPNPGETEGEGFLVEEIPERVASRHRTKNLILARLRSLGLEALDFAYLHYEHRLSFVVVHEDVELPQGHIPSY